MPIDRRTDLDPNYQRSYTGVGGDQNDAVGRAQRTLGFHERYQNAMLKDYLHNGGENLNPAQTAWCASFVNSTLKQVGLHGTGSAVATSYLNWGKPVPTNAVQRNDVVVFPRGRSAGQTGGHVGIATGNIKDGKLEIISGNHGNSVSRTWEPLSAAVVRRDGGPSGAAPVPVQAVASTSTSPAFASPDLMTLGTPQAAPNMGYPDPAQFQNAPDGQGQQYYEDEPPPPDFEQVETQTAEDEQQDTPSVADNSGRIGDMTQSGGGAGQFQLTDGIQDTSADQARQNAADGKSRLAQAGDMQLGDIFGQAMEANSVIGGAGRRLAQAEQQTQLSRFSNRGSRFG